MTIKQAKAAADLWNERVSSVATTAAMTEARVAQYGSSYVVELHPTKDNDGEGFFQIKELAAMRELTPCIGVYITQREGRLIGMIS